MIVIDFIIGDFKDALHLADDHGLTEIEIEKLKQDRYSKWRDAIENQSAAAGKE